MRVATIGTGYEPGLHALVQSNARERRLKFATGIAGPVSQADVVFIAVGTPSRLDSAITDYDSALRLDPKLASSLYGRGLARLKQGDRDGGNADIAAAKAIKPAIAEEFARYGVQ